MGAKYDIFISYRREGGYDTANLIAERLRHAGYNVFFDIDTLTSGKFNEQLLDVINACRDFVLVLPENGLDRCVDSEDWIRREVTCALEHRKNIIPVMLDGFAWPDVIPEEMKELPNYQAVAPVNREYFDLAMKRLLSYLKSKPSFPVKLWLTRAAIVLSVFFVMLAVALGTINHMAQTTCENVATQETRIMGAVDLISDIRESIESFSKSFFVKAKSAQSKEELMEHEGEMKSFLKVTQKDIDAVRKAYPAPKFNLNTLDHYILSFYNFNPEELQGFNAYYSSFYDDLDGLVSLLNDAIETHDYSSDVYEELVDLNLQSMSYCINSFYYAYLGSLSLLPKSSWKKHYELSRKWRYYPNGTPLGLTQDEYEQFQAQEMNRLQELLSKMEGLVKYREIKLQEMTNNN